MISIKEVLKNKQCKSNESSSNNKNQTSDYLNNPTNNIDMTNIDNLSQKSQSELMAELLTVAAQKRQEGSLDNESLDRFKQKVYSSLNKEQQDKLDEIIEMLKT